MPELKLKNVTDLFSSKGQLSQNLKGFESREAQQKMVSAVVEAYNQNSIALIEAGTGTGKSLAYLVPAILWAVQNNESTVISTNTIALQEQLLHKDIPAILQALKVQVKAVLVKGINNYICLRKLDEAQFEARHFSPEEGFEFEKIKASLPNAKDGSKSDLPFVPSGQVWEKVNAELDTCTGKKCPRYDSCYFFKARKKAMDAQIIIANHHLLCADLATRAAENEYKKPCVLPPYSRIILDEAHNLEEVATNFFASQASLLGMLRTLSRLAGEKQGKIQLLKEKLQSHFSHSTSKELHSISDRLNFELANARKDIGQHISQMFDGYFHFQQQYQKEQQKNEENKLRVISEHKKLDFWQRNLIPLTNTVIQAIHKYAVSLAALEQDLKKLWNEKFQENTESLRHEIQALANRMVTACATLGEFIAACEMPDKVNWIESQLYRSSTNTTIISADLDISKKMRDYLFSKFPSVVLCSATMTSNKKFDFILKRLGLDEEFFDKKKITQTLLDSPFDFQKQAFFGVPTDMPDPLHPQFTESASEQIWNILEASRGNAFILFTSYSMLQTCHQFLYKRLTEGRYQVFKQGEDNRKSLLNKFKESEKGVLFGTDSFWEGVDVVGDALRCVILTKLPFKVPSEPIIQARCEAIQTNGGNPFLEYSLPQAIVKFKQGFGRLIRNKQDRGCVICLDNRVLYKNYGKVFLNSLPNCKQLFSESQSLQIAMQEFYRSTHYLTKKS